MAVIEPDAAGEREDLHVFDRWCWLGTVRTHEAAARLAAEAPRVFDADLYRIALKALAGANALSVVELGSS